MVHSTNIGKNLFTVYLIYALTLTMQRLNMVHSTNTGKNLFTVYLSLSAWGDSGYLYYLVNGGYVYTQGKNGGV
jgi:glycopeptide antibiotics resistance protein